MFEDIIKPKIKADVEQLYICEYADQCPLVLCMHMLPHFKTELGRPDDPENMPSSDCSIITCKSSIQKDAVCIKL